MHPWDSTLLELNFSDYRLTDLGYPGWFTYGEKITLPSAPDPETRGYNQEYLGTDLKTQVSEARLKQELSSNWHMVAGVLNQDGTRNINTQVNNLTNNAGSYTSSMRATFSNLTGANTGNLLTFGIAPHGAGIGERRLLDSTRKSRSAARSRGNICAIP